MFALDNDTHLPVMIDSPTKTPFIQDLETCRWSCHVHSNSDCSMTYINGIQYHVVEIKPVNRSKYAINEYNRPPPHLRKDLNSSYGNNDFWEPLTAFSMDPPMICAFDKCSQKFDKNALVKIFNTIFRGLHDRNEQFFKYNTPFDMVHKHILTDGFGNFTLCNRHLLFKHSRPKLKYISKLWERGILKTLFPKPDNRACALRRAILGKRSFE
ncbi:unnamed protein product [Macrosiphum euphorbiae]|uniref:Uncharacterized protein n=1 Tax=Macrosiphum euphorbiae TaxID=13131 RepID=A0AAV0Y0P0_9HEMI|nr:unnamed protein product [Macrosiphum euphorbiae]CAI6373913.1 unnamed protein product [Macrosiphum euphorbiae]